MTEKFKPNSKITALSRAILSLKDEDECSRFLRDICSMKELESMADRYAVVKLLDAGVAYREISKTTGVSTTTVTRVSHWLKYGTGGYRDVLKRVAAK